MRPNTLKRVYDLLLNKLPVRYERLINYILGDKIKKVNIVISTLPPIESISLALRLASKLNAIFIADIQDLADEYRVLERPYLSPLLRYYFNKQVYHVLSKANLILATTEFMAKVLTLRTNNKNVLVIPNGVNVNQYDACYSLRRKFRSKVPIVVFLGDLNWRYHRLESFIQSLRILNDNGVKVMLKVIGSGKYLLKLVKLTKELNLHEQVRFYGYLPFKRVISELGTSSFAIVGRPAIDNLWIRTSIRLTTYEYLACGLPIFAYGPPHSYTQYFINKYKVGVYVPSDNPEKLADMRFKHLELLTAYNVENSRAVGETYDWSICFRPLIKFIKDLKQ